jgi:hypothetical protein
MAFRAAPDSVGGRAEEEFEPLLYTISLPMPPIPTFLALPRGVDCIGLVLGEPVLLQSLLHSKPDTDEAREFDPKPPLRSIDNPRRLGFLGLVFSATA